MGAEAVIALILCIGFSVICITFIQSLIEYLPMFRKSRERKNYESQFKAGVADDLRISRRQFMQGFLAATVSLLLGACSETSQQQSPYFEPETTLVSQTGNDLDAAPTVENPVPDFTMEFDAPGQYMILSTAVLSRASTVGIQPTDFEKAILAIPGALRVTAIAGVDAAGIVAVLLAVPTYASFGGLQAQFEGPVQSLVYDPETGQMILRSLSPDRTALNINQQVIELSGQQTVEIGESAVASPGSPDDGNNKKTKEQILTECGDDVKEIFARWLLTNGMGIISASSLRNGLNFDQIVGMYLFRGADDHTKAEYDLSNKLRAQGCFDMASGGTINSEYKRLRDQYFGSNIHGDGGGYASWSLQNFKTDMPTNDAMALARTIVIQWFP